MNIDEFLDLARKRRSVRKLKPDPIPQGTVEKIIESARWAMSGANAQPWEFIVVTDPKTKLKIAETHLETRTDQYIIELTRLEELRHNLGRSQPVLPPFKDAPVLIIVLGDRRTIQCSILSSAFVPSEGGPDAIYLKDMANATQNLHLAAAACGLGSHTVSVSHTMEQLMKPILNVPEIIDIHTIVAVGYPESANLKSSRRELKDMVHYEQYDKSRLRTGEQIIQFIKDWRNFGKPSK
jgi:5,6-dimethylbenzimidazole synthase